MLNYIQIRIVIKSCKEMGIIHELVIIDKRPSVRNSLTRSCDYHLHTD